MAEGGFRLRKWLTNDHQLRGIVECERNGDITREIGDDETYAKVSLGNACRKIRLSGLAQVVLEERNSRLVASSSQLDNTAGWPDIFWYGRRHL